MRIAFALESLRFSGGHQVVVEHARQLAGDQGFEVTIVDCFGNADRERGLELPDGVGVLGVDDIGPEPFDVVVATWWTTAAVVKQIPADRYAYFIQSLEDRWYSADQPEAELARLTWELGLPVITEATWIADLIRSHRPDVQCHLVRNGVDKAVFPVGTERGLRGDAPLRVLLEAGTGHSPNKGVAEALNALSVTEEPVHTTVVGDVGELRLPPFTTAVPVVPQQELSELYASHDVLLKTSRVEGMYGPPLEAFHRGATVVTTAVTGHDEFVVHGHNGLLVDWDDPVGTARALDLLCKDRALLERLRANALETARGWPSWVDSGSEMASALRSVAAGEPDRLAVTLPVFIGADRFLFDSAMRTHRLKVQERAASRHIEKLEYAWMLAEETHQRAEESSRQAEAQSAHQERLNERLRQDLALVSATNDALEARNAALQTVLDMRIEARLARVARKVRDSFART